MDLGWMVGQHAGEIELKLEATQGSLGLDAGCQQAWGLAQGHVLWLQA
jgi:hypothetical protein